MGLSPSNCTHTIVVPSDPEKLQQTLPSQFQGHPLILVTLRGGLAHPPPHSSTKLSVRKVVPTLTSKSAEICLSMAGAKQLVTRCFILVPAGAVRPAMVCSGHYIELYRSACRGGGGYKRGGRGGRASRSQRFLIEASSNIVVRAVSVRVCLLPPRGQGTAPPFIGQGGGSLQACSTILATCDGMAHNVVE
jgi:hypothetical protein